MDGEEYCAKFEIPNTGQIELGHHSDPEQNKAIDGATPHCSPPPSPPSIGEVRNLDAIFRRCWYGPAAEFDIVWDPPSTGVVTYYAFRNIYPVGSGSNTPNEWMRVSFEGWYYWGVKACNSTGCSSEKAIGLDSGAWCPD